MAPRRKCAVCGSRQWHKEPATGLVICSEGHILQDYRNETNETQELGPHLMRKRKLTSGRRRREYESRADPKLYHGARAEYLYFQCLQLLLRKQIVALAKAWDLPPEFEVVCRDVWALHLSLLPTPPPEEPLLHQQDGFELADKLNEVRPKSSQMSMRSAGEADSGGDSHPEKPPLSELDDSTDSSSSSSSSGDEEQDNMSDLLGGLSESSSSSEDEDTKASVKRLPDGDERTRRRRRGGARGRQDGPASNIAVLMVACWTMRLPVIYVDLVRLIESYDLPYLDPIRFLPSDMEVHLPKHIAKALSPPHSPSPLLLHSLSTGMARKFQATHKIQIPELNAAPVLWRVVRALGGTAVLYDLTKTVAHVASLPLTLHHTLAPSLQQTTGQGPESHQEDNVPPEVAFLAMCMVVLKMVYGLDGRNRVPKDPADPALALPRMHEYLTLIKNMREGDASSKANVFSARSNMPSVDLSDALLDEYVDFCEKALLGERTAVSGEQGLLGDERLNAIGVADARAKEEYFALERRERSAGGSAARGSIEERRLPAGTRQEGEAGLEPGSVYDIYNPEDRLGGLPDEYAVVSGRGAQWAGVGAEVLLRVSGRYERRLARWWQGVQRRERREARRRVAERAAGAE
ncbi:hypothetical protein FA95DRAFT_1481367 [Auriscalpium vulgare]|uniref:Uncharacterized protein n=1 Tax=Auriscalpium vulgare TaxID=40419 RepID=A0ACB8SCL4_9AGAM|nr:hypothetical protein FA95DRAFT_1481367 [Auriscalpium vulgare]